MHEVVFLATMPTHLYTMTTMTGHVVKTYGKQIFKYSIIMKKCIEEHISQGCPRLEPG